jgi:hypothetical protein
MVFPSICPEAGDITELLNWRVKFLPDCEIAKIASAAAKDFPHGKATVLFVLTRIFQRPLMETGAISVRPILNAPESPKIGRTTNVT